MTRLSLEERKNLLASVPWVTRLKTPTERCDGIKWSTVSLRDLYAWGPKNQNPPRGIQDHSRCQRQGWFKFKALKRSWARSGTYCYEHAAKEIQDHYEEHKRFLRWQEKHRPEETTHDR